MVGEFTNCQQSHQREQSSICQLYISSCQRSNPRNTVLCAHLLLSKEKPYSVVCYFCISCHRRNPTVINCNIVCHLLKILKYKNFILIDVCYTYILTDWLEFSINHWNKWILMCLIYHQFRSIWFYELALKTMLYDIQFPKLS